MDQAGDTLLTLVLAAELETTLQLTHLKDNLARGMAEAAASDRAAAAELRGLELQLLAVFQTSEYRVQELLTHQT